MRTQLLHSTHSAVRQCVNRLTCHTAESLQRVVVSKLALPSAFEFWLCFALDHPNGDTVMIR